MNIFCSQQTISQVESVKYLGILIDSKLTWTSHLENLDKKVASGASVLSFISPACATFIVELCNPVTRQAIELESCSNPLRIQQAL